MTHTAVTTIPAGPDVTFRTATTSLDLMRLSSLSLEHPLLGSKLFLKLGNTHGWFDRCAIENGELVCREFALGGLP